MSRTLSATALQAVFAQETSEVFVVLLTIEHDDLGTPIRACSDSSDVVSRSNTFTAYPFELSMPLDAGDAPPRAALTIDNVDRAIVQSIRSITSPADITMEVVLASTPDTVEMSYTGFQVTSVDWDALTVSATLTIESFLAEPFPADDFVPSGWPGLF